MNLRLLVEIGMLLAALGFGAYAIVKRRRQGVPLVDALGLRWRSGSALDLAAGIAIAGLAMAGIYLAEAGLGGIGTAPRTPVQSLGLLALLKMLFTFKEELLMRSLLLTGLLVALRGRAWAAIGLSALAFGCIHLSNPGSTLLSVTNNSLGGVMYGMAFLLSGSLWLPIGLHFAWNFVQGPVLGFPVSGLDSGGLQTIVDHGPVWLTGGIYGPEGGLVGIVFRFLIIAAVLMWTARRGRPRDAVVTPHQPA